MNKKELRKLSKVSGGLAISGSAINDMDLHDNSTDIKVAAGKTTIVQRKEGKEQSFSVNLSPV